MGCGINLLQPKFRFLVSFAGKYLAYDYCVPPLCGDTEGVTASFNHQLLKIYIPHTEPDLFGPALEYCAPIYLTLATNFQTNQECLSSCQVFIHMSIFFGVLVMKLYGLYLKGLSV
ncbi:Squamosa promoter-binding-like protein 7 [Camellia lanceoleosa]|uniref:Squamosa promoter-binding-like protein 7 n=1 Tax=Camellia lanceoleosa TaxID=1840588 RepID=A0ACC0HLU3_9ERIC|nr:Squamosa promoter-binding-like protein 7 [Camellia lanceoleosa]